MTLLMVGLTHSTCDRNEAINLEDATKRLEASIDRVQSWQMDWREILSSRAMKLLRGWNARAMDSWLRYLASWQMRQKR